MDSLEFKPCEEYLNLIKISDERKQRLGLENKSYSSLLHMNIYKTYGYELHHIVPNYRNKHLSTKEKNFPNNIALLTSREHVLAHYFLTKFETGKYKYSAMMAFIQITSLKKNVIETITLSEVESLSDHISVIRKEYFTSKSTREKGIEAGKKAGMIRKLRFEADAEFRKYILSNLQMTPEVRLEIGKRRSVKMASLPPWKVSKLNKQKGTKYLHQSWNFFDTIYIGIFKYNLSYKIIAKVIGVNYKRISNIVKILKTRYKDSPTNFKDFKFYGEFVSDFKITYMKYESELYYYSDQCKVPWNKSRTLSLRKWAGLEHFYRHCQLAMTLGFSVDPVAYNKFLGYTIDSSSKVLSFCKDSINTYGNIENCYWYKYWIKHIREKFQCNPLKTMRVGVYKRQSGKYQVTMSLEQIKYQEFSTLTEAIVARDNYEMRVYNGLCDIRHIAEYTSSEGWVKEKVNE